VINLTFLQGLVEDLVALAVSLIVLYYIGSMAVQTLVESEPTEEEVVEEAEEEAVEESQVLVLYRMEELAEGRMKWSEYLASNVWIRLGIPFAILNTFFVSFVSGVLSENVYTINEVLMSLDWIGMVDIFLPWAVVVLELTKDILHKVVIDRRMEVEYAR
jgi:hypothetical protein